MRIVFLGTPQFSVISLRELVKCGHEIAGVVTVPDKPVGRGLKLQYSAVKEFALQAGLEVLQPADLRDREFHEKLRILDADLFVVVAFRILPEEVFEMPPKGTVNLHSSLLPRYRGAAPINWAIINGDTETGVSTIFIQRDVDAGDLILQQRVQILPEETAGELHDRLAECGAKLLLETVSLIESGSAPRRMQQGEATRAPKLTRELCNVNWQASSRAIQNLVRGLNPRPGAHTFYQSKQVKLFSVRPVDDSIATAAPGEIVSVNPKAGELIVATGDATLAIDELQVAGKRRMQAQEFLLGHSVQTGERFGVE